MRIDRVIITMRNQERRERTNGRPNDGESVKLVFDEFELLMYNRGVSAGGRGQNYNDRSKGDSFGNSARPEPPMFRQVEGIRNHSGKTAMCLLVWGNGECVHTATSSSKNYSDREKGAE